MDNTLNNVTAKRIKERSEKLLDSVGINENTLRKGLEDDVSIKRRSLRITYDENGNANNGELTKWTPLTSKEDSASSVRALQSRVRLEELEDEANSLVERQAARERRAARLRQIVSEFDNDNEVAAVKSIRASRRERIIEEN